MTKCKGCGKETSKPLKEATNPKQSWLDVTDNEIRYRVRDPKYFTNYSRKAFKTKNGIETGVTLLQAENLKTCQREVQALRFDRSKFTETEAIKWIKKHIEILG